MPSGANEPENNGSENGDELEPVGEADQANNPHLSTHEVR